MVEHKNNIPMNTVFFNLRRPTKTQKYFTKAHIFCQLIDLLELDTHPKYQAILSLPKKKYTLNKKAVSAIPAGLKM